MIKNLRQLLASPENTYPGDHILAHSPEGVVTWAQFGQQVHAWELALGDTKETTIALYERNSLVFLAALFAAWRLGKQVLVPANNLPLTCQQIEEITPAFAGNFARNNVIQCKTTRANLQPSRLQPFDASATHPLVLFTSGSSGTPVPVAKQFMQLEAEVDALEKLWGESLGTASISGSVSHQHIYGLLFRLLWPVCAGRPFVTQERDYWEELAADAGQYQPLAIITSPAHLVRIPPLTWQKKPSIIFSSGALLTTEVALSANQLLGTSVVEVYGSTETGGIAWRDQTKMQQWTCLPGVNIRREEKEGLLEVRSAHLSSDDWFTTADRAMLESDNEFTLCGRADRIAKVAGKRISLSSIEQTLEQHPWVDQARVLLLPERGERLGAALVLNHEGNKILVDQGKNALNEIFKTALIQAIDRVAIPRYWRYVASMPRNRQGKTTLAELQQLFSQEPQPRLPEVVSCEIANASTLEFKLFIPANLYYFEGHFPGRPVLPGVVQAHWAIHFAREHWGSLGEFTGYEALKFQQVVVANQSLDLQISYEAAADNQSGKLHFNYTSGIDKQSAHSSGRILFTRGTH